MSQSESASGTEFPENHALVEFIPILEGYGFRPQRDTATTIAFKVEGVPFWIHAHDDDPQFVQIYHGTRLPEGTDPVGALLAANETSRLKKLVKTTIVPSDEGDSVTFSSEFLLESPCGFAPLFDRTISATAASVEQFFEFINTQAKVT